MATKKAAAKKSAPQKTAAESAPARKVTFVRKMKEAAKKIPAAKKKSPAAKKSAKSSPQATLKFPDAGLHIAVLGALLEANFISAELIQSKLEGLDFDEDSSETERLLAAMERLHAIPIDPKQAAQLESLDFDGGNEIYMMLEDGAETETGGEDDTYCLQALTGIEVLSGLKHLSLDGHGYSGDTRDLKPLAGHPTLEVLILSGKCKNATALETMPKLARLDVRLGDVDRPKVLDRLAKLGVEILRRED